LIIGGTGFFGKSILDSFKRGLLDEFGISRVLVLARNAKKFKFDYPELVFSGVELISGDISKAKTIPEADLIIHAASSTNMNDYVGRLQNTGKSNIEQSVLNFCDIAATSQLNAKVLYCSSGAVYGKQPEYIEKISEEFYFQENISQFSTEKQKYCLGKRFAEDKIMNLAKCGLNVAIARCFTFFGKYLPKDQHFAYGNFISKAEKGQKIIVNTNGLVYRSYLSADDLVFSLFKILQTASPECPVYNVGSDEAIAIHDLAKLIAEKYNVDYEYKISDFNNVIDRYVPNVNKLKDLLNKS